MERKIESRTAMHRIRNLLTFRRDRMRSEEKISPRHSLGKEKRTRITERQDWSIAYDELDEHNAIARARAEGHERTVSEGATPIHTLMPGEIHTLFDLQEAFPAGGFHIEEPR